MLLLKKPAAPLLFFAGIIFCTQAPVSEQTPSQRAERFFTIWTRLTPETRQAFAYRLSPTELLTLYEAFEPMRADVEKSLKGSPGLKVFGLEKRQEEYNIETLDYVARMRIAKILRCNELDDTNALRNGTCKPLLNVENQDLIEEQRAAAPFKDSKITPVWVKLPVDIFNRWFIKDSIITPGYWVKLLPMVDIFNRWFKDDIRNHELWKIYFTQVMQKVDEEAISYLHCVQRETREKSLLGRWDSRWDKRDNYRVWGLSSDSKGLKDLFDGLRTNSWTSAGTILFADYFANKLNPRREDFRTNPPTSADELKNTIKNIYISTLPFSIQNILVKRIQEDLHRNSTYTVYAEGIRISELLDSPYTKRNIQTFLKPLSKLPRQPRQVICPKKFINIETKAKTVATEDEIVF